MEKGEIVTTNQPDSNKEIPVTEPTRVKNFATFFKNYMSIWSLVVAALPIPVTSLNLITTFDYQKSFLSTCTTLFCFLILGYIFYSRHKLSRFFFPDHFAEQYKVELFTAHENDLLVRARVKAGISSKKDKEIGSLNDSINWYPRYIRRINKKAVLFNSLPILFIFASLTCAYLYNIWLDESLFSLSKASDGKILSRALILKNEFPSISITNRLIISYLGIFLFAEAAFILMAIKEYIQDILGIRDQSLMNRTFSKRIEARMGQD